MAVFLSRKHSLIILLAGLCAAAGIVLLLCNFGIETRLNIFYDFLLKQRPKPPVSNEIVIIETGDIAEGGDVFDVLMTLSEFNASSLVIVAPILGISSDRTLTDEEIRQRLSDEYSLVGKNIRSFFEAIKIGSIQPAEAEYYVDYLISLTDRGRDRLIAFFLRNAESGSIRTARNNGVFSNVLEATDLGSNPQTDGQWYSRPRLDSGNRLRRIAPVLPLKSERGNRRSSDKAETSGADAAYYIEHIVYRTLKPRWLDSGIENKGAGQVFIAGDFRFPLDYNGNILIEKLHDGDDFRRVSIDQFRSYAEADLGFRRQLKYAESLGAYSNLKPERIPLYLFDYAADLQNDLLKNPSPEKYTAWLHTRREYWNSLDQFLNGDSEIKLREAYDELMTIERFSSDGLAKLKKLRDDLVLLFAEMREKYGELNDMRGELEAGLNSSFCIMGPSNSESQVVEASAMLANTLLTGRCITTAQQLFVILCSMAAVFFLLVIIHAIRPWLILIVGVIESLICAAGFSYSFILTGYWIDPQISFLSCMAGTLVMSAAGFMIQQRASQRFRFAYGSVVNKSYLKQLVRAGQPSLREIQTAGAVVIVVKNTGLLSREDNDNSLHAAKIASDFRAAVTRTFLNAGATLIGCEGGMVLVCFGSPLERIFLSRSKTETRYGDDPGAHGNYHPVVKAIGFITELIRKTPSSWCFGIDYGECAFSWSKETGYIANGRPVVRARILTSLAVRHKAQILITNTVREKINQPARKLNVLGRTDGNSGETFYELLTKN